MSSVAHGRCSNIPESDPTPTFTPLGLRSTHELKVSSIRRSLCRGVRRLLLVTTDRAIAGAPSILNYLRTVAARHGIDKHIKFHHEVLSMDWRSEEQKWRIDVLVNKIEKKTFWARFVVMGTGYYDYNEVSRKRRAGPIPLFA
jgi:cation diffusion facilitator CzcD-associated flavoprotein CzcO